MNALQKIQQLKPNKPYCGFAKLAIGFYEILNFRYVKNKYGKKGEGSGKSILIELDDQVLFLPQYFNQKLDEEDLRELNSTIDDGEKMYLSFGGKHEHSR